MKKTRQDKRSYSRSGVNTLKKSLSKRGRGKIRLSIVSKLNKRDPHVRQLLALRDDIITSRGGHDALTPQALAIIDIVLKEMILLGHIDMYLLSLDSIINRRRKSLLPIVRERMSVADSLIKHLSVIGLGKVAPQVIDLAAFIAAEDAAKQKLATPPTSMSQDSSTPSNGAGKVEP